MSAASVISAFDAMREFMVTPDPGAGGTYDLGSLGMARINVDSTGGVTQELPDLGFIALVHNSEGAGTITVNDTDGNAVASVIDNETALCFRVGAATNKRWHAVVLKMGAT